MAAVGLERVAGKYELGRVLGEGGMGVVHEAVHVRLRQRVAIKILKADDTATDFMARFEREARAAAQIKGPHVAKVLDVDTLEDGTSFIVMELLEGQDLAMRLMKAGVLPIREAADYVQQAAVGLEHAHAAGVIHRDIKPGNLFLCDLEGSDRKLVKILDFGISKVVDDTKEAALTETFATFGTAIYMSPEQMRSAKSADARSDVWSLGIILFQLIVGRPPFIGSGTAIVSAVAADPVPRPREYRADIPQALEAVILKALEKDPAARYQTARELADALVPFAPEREISKVLASHPPPTARPAPLTPFAMTPASAQRTLRSTTHDHVTAKEPEEAKRRPRVVAVGAAIVAAVATAVALTVAMGALRSSPARNGSREPPPPVDIPSITPAAATSASPPPLADSPPVAPAASASTSGAAPATHPSASPPSQPLRVAPTSSVSPPPPPTASPSRTPLHI